MSYYNNNSRDSGFRVNQAIRSKEVFLIDENGNPLGEKPIQVAQSIANERGYDLVEVVPNANPPVCKILDYGKFRYEINKKLQKSKGRKSGELKEIRLGVNTEEHDFNTKLQMAKKFIDKGNKIRITVKMSGRENIYSERAHETIERFRQSLNLNLEQKPIRMGARISAILVKGKNNAKN